MPQQKRRSQHQRKNTKKEEETQVNPYKGQLFSEADAKSVELSGYLTSYGGPQTNQITSNHALPDGVGK